MQEQKERLPSATQAEAVVRALEEDIVLGRLLPRERLIEEDLVQRFGVGRHVVRQSLAELVSMGIVVQPRNKSAAVRDLPPEDVIQIYAIRELLEAKGAELLPLPVDPALLKLMGDIHLRHGEAVKAGNLAEVYRQNMLFHRTFFSGCGNPHLSEAIEQFALKAHIVRSSTVRHPAQLQRSFDEHAIIVGAMRTGDRKLLVETVKAHIRPSMQTYIESYKRRFNYGSGE
ncbi:GntR family transcriptional regulator [Devosia sp. 2618]|uniref:GntR family transcriptional regulator n=1 Tax=Devosia sp. 2618 TaxID=3156454 RepID=UPI00339A7EC7